MTRKQKKRRMARVRFQQKRLKIAKRNLAQKDLPAKGIKALIGMVEGFVESDKESVLFYAQKMKVRKKMGIVFSPIFIILALMLGCNMLSAAVICLAAFPWIEYFICKHAHSEWSGFLEENLVFLRNLNFRLSTSH